MSETLSLRQRLTRAIGIFRETAPAPTARKVVGEVSTAKAVRWFGWLGGDYNPSILVTRKGLATFNDMKRDDQIKAALQFKKQTVIASDWEIVPATPADATDDDNDESIRFITDQLQGCDGGFKSALIQILSSLDYGYSVTEMIFEKINEGEWAGKIGLKTLKTRDPLNISIKTNDAGDIEADGIIQRQVGGNVNLPAWKFLHHAYQAEFQNPYGTSDLEAAYRAWWLKDNAYSWLGMLLERFGIPPIFAFYNPDGLNAQQIEALKNLIETMQAGTNAILPRSNKDNMELWAPEIAGQVATVFDPAMKMFNQDIARALLMPGLLGMTPDSKGGQGSYARSKIIFDVFMFVVLYVRGELEELITDRLVRYLLMLNYPEFLSAKKLPHRFRFKPLTDDVQLEVFDRWIALVAGDVVNRQEGDEEHIRASLKFPPVDASKVIKTEPPPAGMGDNGGPDLDDPEDNQEPKTDDDEDPEDEEREAKNSEETRELTTAEKAVNFVEIESEFDAGLKTAVADLAAILTTTKTKLIAAFSKSGDPQVFLSSFTISGMSEFRANFLGFITSFYDSGDANLRREVKKQANNVVVPGQKGPNFRPTEAMKYLRATSFFVTGIVESRLTESVRAALLTALKNGETTRDTIKRLETVFEPYIGDPDVIDDARVADKARLETIVRTNFTNSFNQGRLVAARDPEIAEFVKGMQYSAIMDSRTTEVCRALDGKVFMADDPSLDKLAPANHFNCRSILVPITIDIPIKKADVITSSQVGEAIDLAGKGFV